VVAALPDPNPRVAGRGLQELAAAGIQVQTGPLAAQAEALNAGFVKRMRQGRPYVRCKLGMSLDGRTAMASGQSKWITGPEARRDVQRLRARSSAILTGIGTVLADDPSLNVRAEDLGPPPVGEAWRQPLRVVVDPHLSTPLDARVVSSPGRTLIATCSDDEEQAEALSERGAEVVRFGGCGDAVNLPALLDLLGQMEVNEVLLETGATLGGAMLQAGLVDEMVLYVAPLLMGDEARGLFRLPGLQRLEDRLELDILDTRAVGRDLRVTARIRQ
jgi:diaminohydroxyphosphoribosylaminopyrimidine deaminase/5-amino-6-(5-phosphoribosylamino)uracil reductase